MAAGRKDKYVSIRIAKFLMWISGFWTSETKTEERVLNGIVGYTLATCIVGLWIETTELYFSMGDFYVGSAIHLRGLIDVTRSERKRIFGN